METPEQIFEETSFFSKLFRFGMWWRVGYGGVRVVLALMMFSRVGTSLADVFRMLVAPEFAEDPTDKLISFLYPIVQRQPFVVTYFLATYFIFWGIIDIFLSLSMLHKKLWAFSVGMVVIVLFMLYEIYRVMHTHSLILSGVIVFELGILWIINRERLTLQKLHFVVQ